MGQGTGDPGPALRRRIKGVDLAGSVKAPHCAVSADADLGQIARYPGPALGGRNETEDLAGSVETPNIPVGWCGKLRQAAWHGHPALCCRVELRNQARTGEGPHGTIRCRRDLGHTTCDLMENAGGLRGLIQHPDSARTVESPQCAICGGGELSQRAGNPGATLSLGIVLTDLVGGIQAVDHIAGADCKLGQSARHLIPGLRKRVKVKKGLVVKAPDIAIGADSDLRQRTRSLREALCCQVVTIDPVACVETPDRAVETHGYLGERSGNLIPALFLSIEIIDRSAGVQG